MSDLMDKVEITATADDVNQLVSDVIAGYQEYIKEHPEAVDIFLKEHQDSAQFVNDNVEEAAGMIVERGIVEKAPIAVKAIPACHITCIKGAEMKEALSDYLKILFEQDPEFIGGLMPEDDFYEVR